jgi:hypothetical protein
MHRDRENAREYADIYHQTETETETETSKTPHMHIQAQTQTQTQAETHTLTVRTDIAWALGEEADGGAAVFGEQLHEHIRAAHGVVVRPVALAAQPAGRRGQWRQARPHRRIGPDQKVQKGIVRSCRPPSQSVTLVRFAPQRMALCLSWGRMQAGPCHGALTPMRLR